MRAKEHLVVKHLLHLFQVLAHRDAHALAVRHVDIHEHHIRSQFVNQPLGFACGRRRLQDVQQGAKPFNLTAEKVPAMDSSFTTRA